MPAESILPVPTVHDLKVKLCYICHEEERYDDPPEAQPKAWTHPCNCTLVAHEQCLLKWIQTSQATTREDTKALQCPQCKATYELESDRPLIFRLLEAGHRALHRGGTVTLVFGVAAVAGLIGTSIYVVCTGYGAWAVEKFIGKEMYSLCLGDDPSSWPWSAYLNLPLIPFSLILTRLPFTRIVSPGLPIILAWPNTFNSRKVAEYWSLPDNARRLWSGLASSPTAPTAAWPPGPLLFALIGLPVVRSFYTAAYRYAYMKVMGTLPPEYAGLFNGRNGARVNMPGGQMLIQVRAEAAEAEVQEDEIFVFRGRDGNWRGPNQRARERAAANRDVQAAQGEAVEEVQENVLEVSVSSLGRKIGGALLIPAISNWMGRLLLNLSRHSSLLRQFLGVKYPLGNVLLPPPVRLPAGYGSMGILKQIGFNFQLVWKGFLGAPVNSQMDPVWWRNTIGLGLFVVAKDCIKLLYLYLAQKELRSRRVKNRDFSNVNINALDLRPDFYARPVNRL